ncbi:phospholipid/cholesterol/gamma-HCH transport system substrate-binding protein [Thermomonospora echinospora]|uniref:Phospholipid/cholesterol/gamma-HCH transport system substrate-binding protein n=1 Tax=Thermomonospora echinospora TaxID=1992 RepID=A0A1H5Z735_9ACTN|nr:MCE family protein [Thermomonospora echinospora]SEG32082.1 phospholipid/cholesterol/gamma-HCH transport system substrate-binding protein [Thermomonospora echinospora]
MSRVTRTRSAGSAGLRRRPARLGLAAGATAAALALSGCGFRGVDSIPLPGGPDLGDRPVTVRAEFANVLDLVPQSVVKLNDVSVGKVTEVELARGTAPGQSWQAVVTFKLRRDVNLPDNARASITQTSLLGEKFVALSPPAGEAPSANRLGDGDLIPITRTSRGAEIEEVLSAMSLLLNGGGLEQVSTITHELNAAMNGRTGTIKSVLHRVDTFVGTLDTNRAAIVRAIDSIDRLSKKLADERATIADTIDRTGPAIDILNRNRADLTKMLVSLDKLSRTTTRVINASQADLVANLRSLDTTLRNLNKAGANLPKALETMLTFPFPATFSNVLRGDYGNLHMTIDLDMKNLTHNLLGGTDLEYLAQQGEQMRLLLKPPSLSVPQPPLGVLPDLPAQPAPPAGDTPGTGGARTPAPAPTASPTGSTAPRPRALAPMEGSSDLYKLMTGGYQ